MASAHDSSDLVLSLLGSATTMKLQKLLYYCQGWHSAWDGEALFDERIEAWANGPVVRDIYDLHRGTFRLNHPLPASWGADLERLTKDERETVEAIVGFYGDWSADQLSRATHAERPWIEARDGLAPTERGTRAISLDTMQDYFSGLMDQQPEDG